MFLERHSDFVVLWKFRIVVSEIFIRTCTVSRTLSFVLVGPERRREMDLKIYRSTTYIILNGQCSRCCHLLRLRQWWNLNLVNQFLKKNKISPCHLKFISIYLLLYWLDRFINKLYILITAHHYSATGILPQTDQTIPRWLYTEKLSTAL